MPTFTDKELLRAQIIGGVVATISLIMAISGKIMLANKSGVPEYNTCIQNTGITMLMVATIWIALASWHRYLR